MPNTKYKIQNTRYQVAFTLIEVLIYTAITAVVGMLMTGILLSVSQVHLRESASTEVTGQLNFVTQTIGRLVRTASNIEIDAGISTSTIKLRMQDDSKDPTYISLVNGVIKLTEGTAAASDLTNTRVTVNALNFKKFVQYPGHDTVSYDVQMTYNSQNPKAQVQRSLSSGIARVSAATFDSNLLPGNTTYEIGQIGSAWKNLYLSGVLNLGTSATDPVIAQNGSIYYNTLINKFKGYASSTWANLGEALWTASSTAIYYNSGNVGIGTTSPGANLDVTGPVFLGGTNLDPSIWSSRITPLQTTAKLLIGQNYSGGAVETDFIANDHGYGGGFSFYKYSDTGIMTNLLTLKGDGNVGIGTTSPGAKLEVGGRIKITNPPYLGVIINGRFVTSQQISSAVWTTINDISGGTFTTIGGKVLISVNLNWLSNSGANYAAARFRIRVVGSDTVTYYGSEFGKFTSQNTGGNHQMTSWGSVLSLPAGTHTLYVEWIEDASGGVADPAIDVNCFYNVWAMEQTG